MSAHYRHRQFGPVWMVVMALFALVAVLASVNVPPGVPRRVASSFVVVPIVFGVLFTSLTTVVTDREFSHFFGPGFWRKRLPLQDIESSVAVRNSWWYGFGIRYTPHGWLYNVWGLDAVEFRLRGGRTFRVGTDEPRQLVEAIERASRLRT